MVIFVQKLKLCVDFVSMTPYPLLQLQPLNAVFQKFWKQESIRVGCIPPTCQAYVLRWPPPDVSTGGRGMDPQVNNFVQVSSDGHQMSLAGGPMSGGARTGGSSMSGEGLGSGVLYSEVQCIMGNANMEPPWTDNDRQTRLKTLPCPNSVDGR